MTLSSCGLIIARSIGRTILAAVRYMILNLLGSGLFLLGVVLLYNLTGHLLMVPMRQAVKDLVANGAVMPLTFALAILTIGLGIKSGLFPFYFWMPDTYGSATPTSAYSSAAQIGYIYMGLGIGGAAGFTAAMFQIIAHAATKSLLFLTTPRLSRVSGDSMLFSRLQGSGRRAVDAGIFFTVAAFSMVGIPIFAGFASKLFFAIAAVETDNPVVLFAVMAALAISVLYFIRTVIRIYSRPADGAEEPAPATEVWDSRLLYRLSALALTAFNLFLGLFSWTVADLIRQGLAMFG